MGLESARIVYYQVPSASNGAVESADGIQPVNFETERKNTKQILALTYPHPQQGEKYALAEVVVLGQDKDKSESSTKSRIARWLDRSLPGATVGDDGTKAYCLKIEKSELDTLFRGLAAQGLLEGTQAEQGPDRLLVDVNGRSRSLQVAANDKLSDLSTRVVTEGKLARVDSPRIGQLVRSTRSKKRDTFYDELMR